MRPTRQKKLNASLSRRPHHSGRDYQEVVRRAIHERWIDMYPNEGKRSGAYSQGAAYDVHPYILMNYNGKFDDVSTLAHELGHTMQSYLSNKYQPFPTADYPIFVAEVASTFNEALLLDFMLRTLADDDVKLSLLGQYLEGIQFTVFRQTQFAEFEMRMHEMAAEGRRSPATHWRSSTSASRSGTTDTMKASAWSTTTSGMSGASSRTSTPSSTSISTRRRLPPRKRWPRRSSLATLTRSRSATWRFSRQVGRNIPIDLLADAGVDMTTREPLDLTMRQMSHVMDEMERILDRR